MRIRQIELNGFKSFAVRTVLEFPRGVTAIVGPNGCGKSNIVDAVRWVLGEQSPKHLRGGAMEDVIFAGNADHAPLGMAEVSLLIERDDEDLRTLEAEAEGHDGEGETGQAGLGTVLARASEVVVTRRYFRSGESEYLINRQPCRLKDIADLFLGTGVGTKAYAIIEQGRVEQLVNANPEDMRVFLEEAAGTTRFRVRRQAAERKLERTRENLARVLDIARELERQMVSLQRHAKRAEEYHRLKDELRAIDLRIMAARRRAWCEEVARLSARIGTLRSEEDTLHERLHRARQTVDAVRQRRQDAEQRLRDVSAAIERERVRAGEAGTRTENFVARAGDLERRAADAAREREDLERRRATLSVELAELEGLGARLGEEAADVEAVRGSAERRRRALAEEGAALEQRVDEGTATADGAAAEDARLRDRLEQLRARRAEVEGRRQRLAEERSALEARLATTCSEEEAVGERLSALRHAVAECDGARRRLEAEGRALREREELAVARWDAIRADLARYGSRLESLRRLQARYEGCTRGAGTLLDHRAYGERLLADVLRVPAELERAVAAALGARLAHVVVPDAGTGVEALAWLRAGEGGSATVIPRQPDRSTTSRDLPGTRLRDAVAVEPGYEPLVDALLADVVLVRDLPEALALWRTVDPPVTVVTSCGEAIDPQGAITGGSEPPLEETLLARARELRELEETLQETRCRAEQEAAALLLIRNELAAVTARGQAADERRRALELELVALQKDRERLAEESARLRAEIEVGEREAADLAAAEAGLAAEAAAIEGALSEVGDRLRAARDDLRRAREALARWRETWTEMEAERTRAAVAAASVAERRRAAEEAVGRLRAALGELNERLAGVERAGSQAAAEAAETRAEALRLEQIRSEAEAMAARLGAERERLIAEIARADGMLAEEDRTEREVQGRLEAVRSERGSEEVALAERRVALEQLAERLAERYGLPLEALADVEAAAEPVADEVLRAEELRGRLARLGDVNPAAAAELAEVRERYEFLSAQRADLERSLDDLTQTINRLVRTSRQRFEETFAAANEKLADVFPKLFPGGRARLALVPGADGEEAGVEIVVQPAGKKLQSLSLLSGGEKALTATALVFSLFLIRPTPFCVLDEVDAPLDEANIGRFNQIVGEMATRTQFVLITHNRRTMEVADTLYGITMEQPGLSKVVSVRLSEAA